MKVQAKLAAIALCAMALGAGTQALAQEAKKNPNQGKATAAAPGSPAAGVEAIHTARQLARYGDANKDPLALIVAARMLKEAGSTPSQAKVTGAKAGDDNGKPDGFTVDALLERAKAAAGGRADLIALADDVAKSGTRGGKYGPGYKRDTLLRGGVHQYTVVFNANQPARVAVSGDGDSDLDLYVYDQNGNLICRDVDATDEMYCAWNPRWTGPFTIRVRNLGIANYYAIAHN